DEGQIVGGVFLVDVLEQRGRTLERGHQERTARDGEPVDRLEPVPGPGLHALRERVVHADRDVHLLGLVAGHVLLELFLRVRDDREVLGRDAVTLRTVPVASEGDPPPPGLPCGEDDAAADGRGEFLLEEAAVDALAGEVSHALPPRNASGESLVGWSDHSLPPGWWPVKGAK